MGDFPEMFIFPLTEFIFNNPFDFLDFLTQYIKSQYFKISLPDRFFLIMLIVFSPVFDP